MLKKIECFIQPFKLEPLTQALVELGVDGMSVTEVRGFGRQRGHTDTTEGGKEGEMDVKFLPKTKLEIVVPEEMVEQAVQLIVKLARTGTVGSGEIFVVPVEDAVRVGTGEVGYPAIV